MPSSLIQPNAENLHSPPVVIVGYREYDLGKRSLWGILENEADIYLKKLKVQEMTREHSI